MTINPDIVLCDCGERCHEKAVLLKSQLRAADELARVLKDVEYCFMNIWALEMEKFKKEFMGRISSILAAYEKSRGR